MEIHDLKFNMTYILRSTRCTPLFHELEDSNSYLYEATEVDSCDSSFSKSKQMFSKLRLNEWMKDFSSAALDLLRNFNCHG